MAGGSSGPRPEVMAHLNEYPQTSPHSWLLQLGTFTRLGPMQGLFP